MTKGLATEEETPAALAGEAEAELDDAAALDGAAELAVAAWELGAAAGALPHEISKLANIRVALGNNRLVRLI
ncbi:MAG TPA: hypothetical protein VMV93_07075 [Chloroflexota bacterium]|nr:hypothetical protein [Chloroflexota bacterium]